MSARFVLIMLALSLFGTSDAVSASTKKHSVKQANHTHHETAGRSRAIRKKNSSHHIANRLVPPPPAYMPSILPELYYRRGAAAQTEDDTDEVSEKPKNPYAKYFYSREGEVPKATQARSGVTTWSALR